MPGRTANPAQCEFGSGTGDLSRATGADSSILAMAAGSSVMVSYPVDLEDGGIRLEKEIEQKDDGRYIIFYTFEDEEAGED
jgi:hypothetical protein